MKRMRLVWKIFLIVLIVLNSTVTYAAKKDYDLGFAAGKAAATENSGSNISAETAWRQHYSSNDYPINIIEDESSYRTGFYDGYREFQDEKESSNDFAGELGKTLGGIYGYRDFQNGIKSNWEKSLPSERTLKRMFNLNMETRDYVDEFLSQFEISFMEGYEESYKKAMLDPIKTSLKQGIKDGEELGKLLGGTFGAKDYYENKTNEFTRDLPTDREILSEYSLKRDSDEYKDGFLSGFKRAYETEYNKAFREANRNNTLRDEKDAYNHGKEVGIVEGELIAINDYFLQATNDWRRSLPNNRDIIDEYNLWLQSSNYRDGFIAGFFDGYSDGYNSKFKEFSQESATKKTNSALIPIRGGFLNSLDNAFEVNIAEGTYFHPVNLTIEAIYNNNIYGSNVFIKASDSYNVSTLNTSNNYNDKKLIEITFEYYGDKQKGGIYRYVDNRWLYLPSKIEDGVISTYIKPSSLSTPGIFSVFIDSNATILTDVRSHWAKDEINSYVRRGFTYGYSDKTFKPERNITRLEFLAILSRVDNWKLDYYYSGNATRFKDFSAFGTLNNIVNYATSYGYISGYPDGTFKPNNPISYKEVEIIMRRVQNNYNFKWQHIATKMLHERLVKSNSFNNMDNKITRAEVVYMLYQLNENRY